MATSELIDTLKYSIMYLLKLFAHLFTYLQSATAPPRHYRIPRHFFTTLTVARNRRYTAHH